MSKFTALLLVAVLCVPVAIFAESDSHAKKIIEMVKDGKAGKYHGHDGVLRTPVVSGTLTVDGTLVNGTQTDTNSTTTVALYTPDGTGQVLLGNTGGTNYIWMAHGTTTNDWKQIHP